MKIIAEKQFGKHFHVGSNLQLAPPYDYYSNVLPTGLSPQKGKLSEILLIMTNKRYRQFNSIQQIFQTKRKFSVHSSPDRKFQKCAARVLIRPDYRNTMSPIRFFDI